MSQVLLMCCACSLLGSSGLGGLFAGGIIPSTGPNVVKESGIEALKQYIPLADELNKKIEGLSDAASKVIVDKFMVDKATQLTNLCTDAEKYKQYRIKMKKADGTQVNILTLSGNKPYDEFIIEYFGAANFQKIDTLTKLKKCPGT